MKTVKDVLTNKNPYSEATYKIMAKRSDGSLPDKKTKPASKMDKAIHNDHIVDSGEYNLRHVHDHAEELAFDFERLMREKPQEAARLQDQLLSLLGPIYKRLKLKIERM